MPRRAEYTNSRVILAEGEEDAAFVRALLAAYSDIRPFDVSPTVDVGEVGGSSGFYRSVVRCDGLTGFEGVTDVVIIGDNDDPRTSFAGICAQIERARNEGNLTRNWGTATAPGVKAEGDPSVSIWMWPSSELAVEGCLESLLWRAVRGRYKKEAACVDAATRCTNSDQWPISKLDKTRVRCFLSLYLRDNAAVTLSVLWRYFPHVIAVRSQVFRPFLQFIRAI
jgi:hypothetical protein